MKSERCQGCGGTGFYAPGPLGRDACVDCGGTGQMERATPTAMAVAWLDAFGKPHRCRQDAINDFGYEPEPLYRASSPLTIEQINALPEARCNWPMSMNNRVMRLIRAVERAHGVGVQEVDRG